MRVLVVLAASLAIVAVAAADSPGISIQIRTKEAQGLDPFPVTGAVASGRPGEEVTIEIKECGSPAPFHSDSGTQTQTGGFWTTDVGLAATSDVRARWRGGVTDAVTVPVHPYMTLTFRGAGRFLIWIRAYDFFGGARAVVERQSGTRWLAVKRVLLRRAPSSGIASTTATVRVKVRKGTLLRAVLPKSQAGRCYLAGVTNTIRT